MSEQEKFMREGGWITATEAQEATGVGNIGTIHNQVKSARIYGTRVGIHWYVSVGSLIEVYKTAPPILKRITALGVRVNPDHKAYWEAAKRAYAAAKAKEDAKKPAKRRGRPPTKRPA